MNVTFPHLLQIVNSYDYIFAGMEAQKTSYPKDKIRILFLENISDAAVRNFRGHAYSNVEKITKNVLDAAKKLQAIGCFCIGVNQVDLKAAIKNGVVVFNAPYSNTRSV